MSQEKLDQLREMFKSKGILADKPGFLDEPSFAAAEQESSTFLINYGRCIHWQLYDQAYLDRAEKIIRIAAEQVRASLMLVPEKKRFGKCIHAGMALSQILDLHGVWNFMVSGAVKISFPKTVRAKPFHFNVVGSNQRANAEFGHKWIYAPPFKIVDITIKLQDYGEKWVSKLPEIILAKDGIPATADTRDLIEESIVGQMGMRGIAGSKLIEKCIGRNEREFMTECTPIIVKHDELSFKYMPVTVGGSDGPLKDLASFVFSGETPYENYLKKIKPLLDAVDAPPA